MKRLAVLALAATISCHAFAKDPDCAYADGWAPSMAQGILDDFGLFDAKKVDFKKSTVTLLGSQRTGKDLYRQVLLVRFIKHDGGVIQAITTHDASHQECSMSDVDVYPISGKLGNLTAAEGHPKPSNLRGVGEQGGKRNSPAELAAILMRQAKVPNAEELNAAQATVTRMSTQRSGKGLTRKINLVDFRLAGKESRAIVVEDFSNHGDPEETADVYLVSTRLNRCDLSVKDNVCPNKALPPPPA